MKFILITSVAVATSVLLFVGFLVAYISYASPHGAPTPAEIRIEQGESFAAVVRKLREQKVITNERLFSLWARFTGLEKKIHWGLYRFDTPLPPREVLKRMIMGKGIFQSVTIPEGLTVKEIADLLANLQVADKEKFLTEAAGPELLASAGLQDKGIEGYLFPNTYHFTPATPERDILMAMTEQFRKVFAPLVAQQGEAAQLTAHEIIILASIIEKETGVDAERPLISAVFYNRMQRHMPLQSDPTVIYGLKGFNGNLTKKDLNDANLYNTYRISGLPPGPICNPGLSSIKAALRPADVPFLYFVSKNDGTHVFSESLEAHNQAVKKYQPVREPAARQPNVLLRRR